MKNYYFTFATAISLLLMGVGCSPQQPGSETGGSDPLTIGDHTRADCNLSSNTRKLVYSIILALI